jgi:hypothetical protein
MVKSQRTFLYRNKTGEGRELQEVFVVPTSVGNTEADILRAVGEMGALYLERQGRRWPMSLQPPRRRVIA